MRKVIPFDASMVPPEAKCVFQGIIYGVYQWEQKLFDGTSKTFEMLKRPDTVKVIAIKDNKLIITDQEQPGGPPFYDIPGGRHDDDSESELEAAQRELLEETGFKFRNWKLLDISQPFIKIESFVYIFLATDLESAITATPDAGEKITLEYLSLDETKALISDPKNRYLPKAILEQVDTIEALISLPEYQGKPA